MEHGCKSKKKKREEEEGEPCDVHTLQRCDDEEDRQRTEDEASGTCSCWKSSRFMFLFLFLGLNEKMRDVCGSETRSSSAQPASEDVQMFALPKPSPQPRSRLDARSRVTKVIIIK